ncbi:MAG: endo-1,4-beta-xylanase [Acidobacteriota bacterium]
MRRRPQFLKAFLALLAVSGGWVRAQGAEEPFLAEVRALLPDPGTLCFGTDLDLWTFYADPNIATFTSYTPVNQPFSEAVRIAVREPTDPPWGVQFLSPPSQIRLGVGEVLLFVFHARSAAAGEKGRLDVYIQGPAPDYATIGSLSAQPDEQWRRYYVAAQAERYFSAGTYRVTFHLGGKAQEIELGGMALLHFGNRVELDELPYNPLHWEGEEETAAWRQEAGRRIDEYRKADLEVRVIDEQGRPVVGVPVRIRLLRHTYTFGSVMDPVLLENSEDGRRYREWFLRWFNRATAPIYWADWGWENAQTRSNYLQMAAWAQHHRLAIRGHVLVYPRFDILPGWVGEQLRGDPEALQAAILEHIAEAVTATYPFRFSEYDVTNELRDAGEVLAALGGGDQAAGRFKVVEWFAEARRYNRYSRMGLNEYSIVTRGGETAAEQRIYEEWLQFLADQGQPVDVIGIQGHFVEDVTPPTRVWEILNRFAAFGVPLQITEYDLVTRDEAGQARYLRDFLTAVFSHPATDAFTMWGFWAARHWRPLGALIRENWTLKPAGEMYEQLVLHDWWTDETLTTDGGGAVRLRGFMGEYVVSVTGAASASLRAGLGPLGGRWVLVVRSPTSPPERRELRIRRAPGRP